ncbi:S-layer homology domain-containing protein [Solibacillus sp. FSL W8-0474]|uniref:S-layer homology domain-containing protein n=1 Tax=Solibacillus sp. FSL W8-0474 TaxID=2975336 RepID=UPI0030F6EFFC
MANQPKKYKKFVATAATATLVASAIVPVASAASLTDISGNTHEAAINALVDAQVISGYPDGTFKPNKELTRSDVVKLLGKYLVSQGHSIPTDATSNPRFADLSSKTNKELLEYAAVVADAGVFAGSNGKLLAGDAITRENMAIVLVRMVNTLNDVSLEEFVASQDFNREVKDINAAKAEARTAIDVLDFYDITTVANFLPKNTVTRGQFATFLNNVIKADFSGAEATTGTVKAINATTVEVTFAEEVTDVQALDFKISGLEVSNKVVKQTDKKTVVLTTSPQTAGVEYTVTVNGDEVGKFTGVSAVIPTKVEMVTSSVQGKLGQQVSVQAKVTVAEGQSKAGIPVTFSIPGNNNDAVYPTVTGEAFTNADGVATYTYTRYGAGTDSVTAYATGDRSKFAIGYVFWGVEQILTITEVTEGATINNGANKTYKVTYKNPTTGRAEANVALNVGVLENMNVTADKLQNVTVNGVKVAQLSNNTNTTAARITTDSKGEATFTLSGTNAEVTPVVFAANDVKNSNNTVTADHRYDASDLQTTAAKVKFAAVQAEYTIELTRDGGEVAATGEANGREYKVLVKDKAGNVAKNETVNVAFNEDLDRVIATNTKAGFVNPDTEKFYPVSSTGNKFKQISVKTNDKGEASFIIATDAANVNDYATPIAWIDINNADAKQGSLDEGEPKTIAAISHFQAPYLDGAEIKSYKAGKKATKFDSNETAEFKAELVNQSGKVFTAGYTMGNVTYTVYNDGAEDVKVGSTVISPNRSQTFTIANGGSLFVTTAENKSTSVRVVATGIAYKDGKDFAFTAKEATATFTNSATVTSPYTGFAVQYNKADTGSNSNSLWFAGKNPVKYAGVAGKTFKYYGANGNEVFGELAWEAVLDSYVGRDVQISYSVDGDTISFKVIPSAGVTTNNPLASYTAPTTKSVNADVRVASSQPTLAVPAKITSSVIGNVNVPDFSFTITATNSVTTSSDTGTVTVLATDSANNIAAKINAVIGANGLATATVENGRVVITGSANVNLTTAGANTDVFSNTTVSYLPATAVRSAVIDYDFAAAAITNITTSDSVTVNGITYTGGTTVSGLTFDASGTLAQDLVSLALVISMNDPVVIAGSTTTVLTLTEKAGKEGQASTSAITFR